MILLGHFGSKYIQHPLETRRPYALLSRRYGTEATGLVFGVRKEKRVLVMRLSSELNRLLLVASGEGEKAAREVRHNEP